LQNLRNCISDFRSNCLFARAANRFSTPGAISRRSRRFVSDSEKNEFPENCTPDGAYLDGVVVNDDHQPRKIEVEFIAVSHTRLVVGSTAEGTIRLQNVGDKSIQIPWSTNFPTTQTGQDAKFRSWQVGTFQIKLKSAKNSDLELKSTSRVLFGSKLVSGTMLTVKPGEWITAQISFEIEPPEGAFQEVTQRQFELFAEWSQTARTHQLKDCGATLGYYSYGDYYQQSNPRIEVTVESERHDNTKEISKQPSD
jgi:hypothetical protein